MEIIYKEKERHRERLRRGTHANGGMETVQVGGGEDYMERFRARLNTKPIMREDCIQQTEIERESIREVKRSRTEEYERAREK